MKLLNEDDNFGEYDCFAFLEPRQEHDYSIDLDSSLVAWGATLPIVPAMDDVQRSRPRQVLGNVSRFNAT